MPISPARRYSPGRELRSDNHKRGRSLENGISFKHRERDEDDLALFNEVQTRETDNFLLQTDDDFEDTFVTNLRHFSDHKLGINVTTRGESSDLLNAEDEKNDYEWLITPPDTPLFPSLDDDAPQLTLAQRGRPRAQPITISRSSTMEKSRRSSRGSPSPNRLSISPRSREPTFQPRSRASSVPSSSPPPTRTPVTGSSPVSRRPSSPSSKPSTPPPRASTPTSRRLSTGSVSTVSTGARGVSPVKTSSRGNSASPKVRAWQANIPGFSTEAPPNLRTSIADRPASYVRGSSPASRNGRHSKSPSAPRSISSSHSHDRDKFSSYSKGSVVSSADDDVESLPSVIVDASERSSSTRASGIKNNKAPFAQKPSRTVSSSSAPKRSFDQALRQMDHRKGHRNMFRPLLSSVPSTNFYAGKASPAWNSSVTTSSNASSDLGTSGPHDMEESELIEDDATSEFVKVPDSNVGDEVFMFEETGALDEDLGNETYDNSSSVQIEDFKEDLALDSQLGRSENLAQHDTAISVVSDDEFAEGDELKVMLICTRCGCSYSAIQHTEDDIKLCANCRKSDSSLASIVAVVSSQAEATMSDKDHESFNIVKSQMTVGKVESPEVTSRGETQSEQHENLVKDCEISASYHTRPQLEECEQKQASHEVISQPSYSDVGDEQIQHTTELPSSKVDSLKREGISIVLKRSTSVLGPVIRSGNFSASSMSYDDFSYARDSTNSLRSSFGRGSVSASSSVDFGPRFHRQLSSRKSDIESYKYDPMNVKHRRSVSSLSGASSHAFHPSSVGTSTLDSSEVPIIPVETYVADPASVVHRENQSKNNTITENEGVVSIETTIDSGEVHFSESSNIEEPAQFPKVEDVGEDASALTTCTSEKPEESGNDNSAVMACSDKEGTSTDPCFENTDVTEAQLDAISEGELDQTCSSSSNASQSSVSQRSERSIEEFQDPPVSTALGNDIAAPATDCDNSNHSSSIMEESTVLVEGQRGTKGRSLTLEEATDTILFCSSIVQTLAYEAATVAIEKETPPDPSDNNGSWPLIPAVGKGYSDRKDVQPRKTSKRSSKSQKTRQKKTMETDSTKVPITTNTGDENDLPKTRIVYPNNKENTLPPKLESKCNCVIM